MREDPIVEEVRNAGNFLAAQAGNDLHEFCELLRKAQSRDPQRLVRREPRRIQKSGLNPVVGIEEERHRRDYSR